MNTITTKQLSRLIGLALLLLFGSAQSQVCRVSLNGSSGASGASWQQTKDLQSALNNPGQCPEIWVKSGTYYPTSGNNRNISFSVKPGVKLYGGFYGTEVALTQRDYIYNKATLSGNIGLAQSATDNSRHVLYLDGSSGSGITQSTQIDGFIIRDGYADNSNGGGLFCNADGAIAACSPILRNLLLTNNSALYGGAIYNQAFNGGDTRPVIENVRFTNNKVNAGHIWGDGGAIYNEADAGSTSSPVLFNVEFTNNQAQDQGGAMASFAKDGGDSSPIIYRGTFADNSAKKRGCFSQWKYQFLNRNTLYLQQHFLQ